VHGLDIEFSCNAAALPERIHFVIGSKWASPRLGDRLAFIVAQDVDTGAARFDCARNLGKLPFISMPPLTFRF